MDFEGERGPRKTGPYQAITAECLDKNPTLCDGYDARFMHQYLYDRDYNRIVSIDDVRGVWKKGGGSVASGTSTSSHYSVAVPDEIDDYVPDPYHRNLATEHMKAAFHLFKARDGPYNEKGPWPLYEIPQRPPGKGVARKAVMSLPVKPHGSGNGIKISRSGRHMNVTITAKDVPNYITEKMSIHKVRFNRFFLAQKIEDPKILASAMDKAIATLADLLTHNDVRMCVFYLFVGYPEGRNVPMMGKIFTTEGTACPGDNGILTVRSTTSYTPRKRTSRPNRRRGGRGGGQSQRGRGGGSSGRGGGTMRGVFRGRVSRGGRRGRFPRRGN